jgi:hypothetical protein
MSDNSLNTPVGWQLYLAAGELVTQQSVINLPNDHVLEFNIGYEDGGAAIIAQVGRKDGSNASITLIYGQNKVDYGKSVIIEGVRDPRHSQFPWKANGIVFLGSPTGT